ncbi:hypothetical protein NIES4074_65200 (plasmid) [Cylindrospermum sp. NIES-4074]|nr:hypothetical protein NIES4074_65200 [Cylindrospermum sp. NIES-4074]
MLSGVETQRLVGALVEQIRRSRALYEAIHLEEAMARSDRSQAMGTRPAFLRWRGAPALKRWALGPPEAIASEGGDGTERPPDYKRGND